MKGVQSVAKLNYFLERFVKSEKLGSTNVNINDLEFENVIKLKSNNNKIKPNITKIYI